MKKITSIFILTILVAIGIYDVIAFSKGGTESTISHMMITWGYNYPAFTFLIGFTMGHLFWRMRDTKETERLGKE